MNHILRTALLLIATGFIACSPMSFKGYKYSGEKVLTPALIKPLLSEKGNALRFHCSIDFFHKHFSGILVYKQTDSVNAHIVFVTEVGMKIFDFEAGKDSLHLVSCIYGLDSKPKAINLLKSDLRLMLLNGIIGKTVRDYEKKSGSVMYLLNEGREKVYYKMSGNGYPEFIMKRKSLRRQVRIRYNQGPDNPYSLIRLKHYGLIFLRIELRKLESTG